MFSEKYAQILNDCFTKNEYLSCIGEAILTPLQKPKKPKGPMKSLRPLTLSNCARKILSLVTLHRISVQVDNYTQPWQCGYKHGRSCSDLVWCQRMLISVVMEKKWEFHKIGIDMSSAFDTINRQSILNLLADAGCTEDEIRLVRFLLSNTKLRVRVNNTLSAEFISTEGAFQGDSLSGTLFTLTLAGALNHVRAVVTFRPNPPIASNMMPTESEYSDDVDYIDEDHGRLVEMLPTVKRVLSDWCLYMNEDKTEHVHIYLAQRGDVDSNGKSVIDNEQWRSSKLLGSLLCSVKDIQHRIILANIAFNNFSSVWSKGRKISLQRLLRVYDAQVISVLLYNCSSWAVPQLSLIHI